MHRYSIATAFLLLVPCAHAGPFDPKEPTFEIQVSSAEIEPMRFAAEYGISRYGGDVSFETRIARVPQVGNAQSSFHDVNFTFLLRGQRTIDAWAFWCAEQTTQFLSMVNLDQLDERSKTSLKSLQTLNTKLSQAKLNPRWEWITTSATVGMKNPSSAGNVSGAEPPPTAPTFTLAAGGQLVEVVGPGVDGLNVLVGKKAIVKGVVKVPGVMELVSAHAVKEHTLELVIMSQCPFGAKAADAVIEYLKSPAAQGSDGTTPELSIRYLFYQNAADAAGASGKGKWWSLHGDAEVAENLVQMTIRDLFPAKFRDYMQQRAKQPTAPWKGLAIQVGLTPSDTESIEGYIAAGKDAMIASEHEYVAQVLGVTDGSPTFVWESQVVSSVTSVPEFASMDLNHGSCAGDGGHP